MTQIIKIYHSMFIRITITGRRYHITFSNNFNVTVCLLKLTVLNSLCLRNVCCLMLITIVHEKFISKWNPRWIHNAHNRKWRRKSLMIVWFYRKWLYQRCKLRDVALNTFISENSQTRKIFKCMQYEKFKWMLTVKCFEI